MLYLMWFLAGGLRACRCLSHELCHAVVSRLKWSKMSRRGGKGDGGVLGRNSRDAFFPLGFTMVFTCFQPLLAWFFNKTWAFAHPDLGWIPVQALEKVKADARGRASGPSGQSGQSGQLQFSGQRWFQWFQRSDGQVTREKTFSATAHWGCQPRSPMISMGRIRHMTMTVPWIEQVRRPKGIHKKSNCHWTMWFWYIVMT